MKNILIAFLCFAGLGSSMASAQSFTVAVPSDTVSAVVSGLGEPANPITNITGANLTLKWYVVNTTFPDDWLTEPAFGICDNSICRNNTGNMLWNPTTRTADTFTSIYPANSAHDTTETFNLSMNLAGATTIGTYWVTINVTDQGPAGTSKNLTFIVSKFPAVTPEITNVESRVILYPNPAHEDLNVVYDASADVKTIAVYNIIGKVMAVYKVTDNSSANLTLENLPSGLYFARLVNAHGDVVVTRKFTKQ